MPQTPSSNWAKLKEKLPPPNPSTQRYLKKRKRLNSQTEPGTKPTEALMNVLSTPEASTSASAQDPGKYIAMDCEFVGVGPNGTASSLARVSIVNYHGNVVLDTFVRQKERVTDYRTWVSGVRASDLRGAPTFEEVAKQVADLCHGRILVGHALWNDLQVLYLSHPKSHTRDTQTYKPLQELGKTNRPSLRNLSKLVLGLDIQAGEHSSVEDAQATMAIFRAHREAWEASLAGGHTKKPPPPLIPKSAIDPTRRYRHARTLRLSQTAAEEGLVQTAPDDTAADPESPAPQAKGATGEVAAGESGSVRAEAGSSSMKPPKAKKKKVSKTQATVQAEAQSKSPPKAKPIPRVSSGGVSKASLKSDGDWWAQ